MDIQTVYHSEVEGSKNTQATKAEEYTTESDLEELELFQTRNWQSYQKEITILEQSVLKIFNQDQSKIVEVEKVKVQLYPHTFKVELIALPNNQEDRLRANEDYQTLKNNLTQEIERLLLSLQQKQSQLKILHKDLNNKISQVQKLKAKDKLNQEQKNQDISRLHNQNVLLHEQIDRLKKSLNSTILSTKQMSSVNSANSLPTFASSANQHPQIVIEPRRPGVQILKITSSQSTARKNMQTKQTASSPIKYLNSPPKKSSNMKSESSDFSTQPKNKNDQFYQTMREQNQFLRNTLQKLNLQLDVLRKNTVSVNPSSKFIDENQRKLTSEIISMKNKISSLESNSKILQFQNDRLKKDNISKENTLRKMREQARNYANDAIVKYQNMKKEDDQYKISVRDSDRVDNLKEKQMINQLTNQVRTLQGKLNEQKNDKDRHIQMQQVQINKMAQNIKNLTQQKDLIKKQLSLAKNNLTLNDPKQKQDKRVKMLQAQIQSLTTARSNTSLASNRYVSSSTYDALKQQYQKQKKSMAQGKEKLKQEINTLNSTYIRLTQQNSEVRAQSLRIQNQSQKLKIQNSRITRDLQSLKSQLDNTKKILKSQQNQMKNLRASVSFDNGTNSSHTIKVQSLNQQIRGLGEENRQLRNTILEYKQLLSTRNLNAINEKLDIYEGQIKDNNTYISSLLNNISEKQQTIQLLQNQNQNLKKRMSNSTNQQLDQSYLIQITGELEYEQKMTQKLSQHVKQLKIQNQNLLNDIDDKDQIISTLNLKLSEFVHPHRGGNFNNKLNHLPSHQDPYGVFTAGRNTNIWAENEHSDSTLIRQQLQSTKNQLQKALHLNNYLRECLYQSKRTSTSCNLCLQYQDVVLQLQRRINIYEVMMMSELRGMFVDCESKLNESGYNWLQVENIIYDLRSRTLNHRFHENYEEENMDKYADESPVSSRFAQTNKPIERREGRLDDIIKQGTMTSLAITILMIKICERISQQKTINVVLPEYIYVLYLNPNNPLTMKVEFIEIKNKLGDDYRLYLAPEVLKGGKNSGQSLVWNLGTIFNQILNRKPYFVDQKQISDYSKSYHYSNKQLPQFKKLMEGMLDKQPRRRLTMQKVVDILKSIQSTRE